MRARWRMCSRRESLEPNGSGAVSSVISTPGACVGVASVLSAMTSAASAVGGVIGEGPSGAVVVAEALVSFGGIEAGLSRWASGVDIPGVMGTHSRAGVFRSRVSAAGSVSTSTSAASCDDNDGDAAATVVTSSSGSADAWCARLRHFSRARKRFGVCGPRADSGEKPSKATQAAAKLGILCSFGSRSTVGRLRRRSSFGPDSVASDRAGEKGKRYMSAQG